MVCCSNKYRAFATLANTSLVPWSHIALDFVSGLPWSEGISVILTVVDRFSKVAHLVSLPKLPLASDTGKLLAHVFFLHGIPVDIVSDRGPQSVFQVWKSFCQALGAGVSLTSGYNPQSSRQMEHLHQELKSFLCCLASTNPSSWNTHLVSPILLPPQAWPCSRPLYVT